MIDLLVASVDEVLAAADRVPARGGPGARRLVDAQDLVAAESRLRPEDARRTLAGRAALRMLVAVHGGGTWSDAAGIGIDRTCDRCGAPHGRPRIDGISVSSSTSGPLVLVAIGDEEARVGVDVERLPDALWDGFDAYALHPVERTELASDAGVDERIGRWTEKEALLKAAGVGLRVAPARLRLDGPETVGGFSTGAGVVDPGAWRAVAADAPDAVAGLWATRTDVGARARAAVAASTPQPLRRWSVGDLLAAAPHRAA